MVVIRWFLTEIQEGYTDKGTNGVRYSLTDRFACALCLVLRSRKMSAGGLVASLFFFFSSEGWRQDMACWTTACGYCTRAAVVVMLLFPICGHSVYPCEAQGTG